MSVDRLKLAWARRPRPRPRRQAWQRLPLVVTSRTVVARARWRHLPHPANDNRAPAAQRTRQAGVVAVVLVAAAWLAIVI
ncbi:MAG: hypothetical protein H6843_01460 [Rhodospirillaceae bacterium]|nr:hypothetical protein [Rhodospirillaceae bacterium]